MTTKHKRPKAWVRLECVSFGCEQHDGITPARLAALGWTDVRQVRSWEESVAVYEDRADEPPGYSLGDWETHTGLCPACAAKEAADEAARAGKARASRG